MDKIPTFPVGVVAKICGLSERQVHRLAKDKILSGSSSRGHWPITNVTEYIEHLRVIRTDGGQDAHAQKTRLLKEQADKLAMANALARGESLPRGEVHVAVTGSFARVRSKLLALPSKLSPCMAPAMTPAKAQQILKDDIYAALDELATPPASGWDTRNCQWTDEPRKDEK